MPSSSADCPASASPSRLSASTWDDDRIAVAGGAAIEVGVQGALGDESEGVGSPLAHRDLGLVFRIVRKPIGRGLQRALHDRSDFR